MTETMTDDFPFSGPVREALADVQLSLRQGEMLSALLDIAGMMYEGVHMDDEGEQPHSYAEDHSTEGCMLCERLATLERLGGQR